MRVLVRLVWELLVLKLGNWYLKNLGLTAFDLKRIKKIKISQDLKIRPWTLVHVYTSQVTS